ncbi:hypothetical protein JCM15519_15720 [Fundidesulfovibrio butyratiphilus]
MTKKFFIFASAALIVLGLCMWRLGLRAQQDLSAVANSQFNRQQFILAEKIAHDITLHYQFLQTNLLELAQIWRRQAPRREDHSVPFGDFQEILRQSCVLAIGVVLPGGSPKLLTQDGFLNPPFGLDVDALSDWSKHAPSEETVLTTRCVTPSAGPFVGRTVNTLVTRLHSEQAGIQEPGTLFFVVDAQAVARRYAHDVRSGQTGYAWVIDSRGDFLDHYVEEFIGKSAFHARSALNAEIDFSRVNTIMRDRMLAGEQGEDWYVSGWHRASRGIVKKLIAYHPAPLGRDRQEPVFWSVAVVAPISEAEEIISSVLSREMLMAGAFQVVVFCGLAVTVYFALRWSSSLKSEVDIRTAELIEARDTLHANLKKLIDTQERLIRSERFAAIGEAAAHISHEIKNPLMIIGGFARQVRRVLDPSSKEAHKLEMVEEETQRLESMLNEVRDFTRPAAPKLEFFDINATVRDTVALVEAELTARNVAIKMNLAPILPPTPHDPAQMRQVLLNLIKNAAEAMESGGTVTLTSRADQNCAEILVEDTGPGLAPDQLKMVFNPFFTTKEHGTGLGLAVCFRIMSDHHGDIRVESTPGKGCRFTLSLPLDHGRAAETTA